MTPDHPSAHAPDLVGLVPSWQLALVALALVICSALLMVRMVPAGSWGFVLRRRRVTSVRGPRPMLLVPGLHRLTIVPDVVDQALPLTTRATTREGLDVCVWCELTLRVDDPERILARGSGDPVASAVLSVEQALCTAIEHAPLDELCAPDFAEEGDARDAVARAARGLGWEVTTLAVLTKDVRATPALSHWRGAADGPVTE